MEGDGELLRFPLDAGPHPSWDHISVRMAALCTWLAQAGSTWGPPSQHHLAEPVGTHSVLSFAVV